MFTIYGLRPKIYFFNLSYNDWNLGPRIRVMNIMKGKKTWSNKISIAIVLQNPSMLYY